MSYSISSECERSHNGVLGQKREDCENRVWENK